ncbi:MAG: NfeD family protein [Thermoplasmata archaeon]
MEYWVTGLVVLIIGMILLVVEVATPGQTFMAIPGTVAVVLGLIMMALGPWLFSEVWYAPVIALLVVLPVTVITIWFYRKLGRGHPPITTVGDSLIGRQGVVIERVEPESIKGKVKVASQIWSATADTVIEPGERVEVVASEGVHVHVERVEKIARIEREMMEKQERGE